MTWWLIGISVALLSGWMTGRLARKGSVLHSLDHPNDRSLHTEPTPRSGGLAILVSVFLGLAAAASGGPAAGAFSKPVVSAGVWGTFSIVLIAGVSLLDDRRGLSVWSRLGAQTLAALIVLWALKLALPAVSLPGIGRWSLGWLSVPVSAAFLLWMTNLYNFMDGMDGFAGGMTVIGFGFLSLFVWRADVPMMFMALVLISTGALGFLFHNFPPAKIFLGDVGSIPLGFTAGTAILWGIQDGLFDLWTPIILFSPFIVDATLTVLRRTWKGCRVWEAHREHYYQRLVLSGWSHRRVVLGEYAVMMCCGMLAVGYQYATDGGRLAILGLWICMFSGLALAVNRIERHGRARAEP